MNDEQFLEQLNEIVPQEDAARHIYVPADNRQLPQTLPARAWVSERTRHIVWELPAEPRFQVSHGGLRRDWKWVRPVALNTTFLALFILALAFWPHARPRLIASASSEGPSSSSHTPQTFAAAPTVTPPANTSVRQSATQSRADIPPVVSPAFQPARRLPSLYAGNPIQNAAPVRASYPAPVGSYRVTSYRVAPAAPVAGSMPPMQSPY